MTFKFTRQTIYVYCHIKLSHNVHSVIVGGAEGNTFLSKSETFRVRGKYAKSFASVPAGMVISKT